MRPDDDFPWLKITAFNSLRWFDAVGSVTDGHQTDIWRVKWLKQTIPESSLLEQLEEVYQRGNWLTQFHLKNSC